MNVLEDDTTTAEAKLALALLTPARRPDGATSRMPEAGAALCLEHEGALLHAQIWGDGPTVLLVHGWNGRSDDLAAFISPLLSRGRRVVAVDLPAHGRSEGVWTSIPAAARALGAVANELGTIDAIVAHSVGGVVAATAVHDGLETARMALIAAPAHYIDYVRQFAQQVALDPSRLPALVTALQAFGVDVESISLPRMAARMRAPALFVHSEDDQVVPISDAEQTVAGWPASSLLRVAGLGHKRILHDTSVLKAVIDFVAAYPE